MHARVITLEGTSDQVHGLDRTTTERILPLPTQMNGFRGMVALTDRKSGKVLVGTLWESEEALR